VRKRWPRFHTRTVSSSELETRLVVGLSMSNVTTALVWPLRTQLQVPVARSQTRMTPSSEPETNRMGKEVAASGTGGNDDSGSRSRLVTPTKWPYNVKRQAL